MKILSFGDTHIGTDCDEDVSDACNQIANKAEKLHPDLIIHTGDVYEGTSDPENRNQARDMFTRLGNICPVLVIKGNHDIRKDLDIWKSIKTGHYVYVFESPGIFPLSDGNYIHILPWFTKAGWIAAKAGIEDIIADTSQAVSTMALTYLKGQIAKAGPGKHFLFAHLLISGSRAENHQPLIGEGITFGYYDLVEAGFSAGAFGHIHLMQTFGDRDAGSPEFRYNGAVAALNYGESSSHKSFSILDTDTMIFDTHWLHTVRRVTVDAFWNGDFDEEFKSFICNFSPATELRLRVKLMIDEGYQLLQIDAKQIVKDYVLKNLPASVILKDLKIETQRKPKDLVRAKEVASARAAADKLTAYWSATGSIPEEPIRSDMIQIVNEIEAKCLIK
jgi:DNA repair exonuclease SbcCD nuclease subunit